MKSRLSSLLLLMSAAPVSADHLLESWYWHAFASQALVYTSDNNLFGASDDSLSADLRELGLILGAQPHQDVHLATQILSRQAGEIDETDLQVDYAFASYTPVSGLDGALGIRVGRVRSPLGFFNETRDVAHTRPSILLPQSIYPERLRHLTFTREGAQLFGNYQQGLSNLALDLSYSRVALREEDYPEIIEIPDLEGRVQRPFSPLARLLWDWDVGRVRLGVTYADFSANYRAAPVDFFRDADLSFKYWIFSAEYNTPNWSLISEHSRFTSNIGDLIPGLRYQSKGHGYYVQAVYRFQEGWEGFLRWDALYTDEKRRDDPAYFTEDAVLGLGWRPDSNWLLRAEWHLVEGLGTLSKRENDPGLMRKDWQLILFQISYRI